MSFNVKIRLFANHSQLFLGKADIYFNDTMAMGAGKMMVMCTPTNAIAVRTIGKLDTV
jgi:hypothetical protein